jgi:uncharacterized membrane protein YkvA (DUF1232 family)
MSTQKLDADQQTKILDLKEEVADQYDEKKAEEFIRKNQDKTWYEDFMLLFNMIRDKNFTLNTKTKLAIAGAIAYVVMPVDVIPDFLPIIGWIDDVFVLNYTIKSIRDEIARYKEAIA